MTLTPFTSLDRFPAGTEDAPVDRVLAIKSPTPDLAHLRFEWHPRTGKVYWMVPPTPEREAGCLRRGERPVVTAEVLAEHCEDYGLSLIHI